MDPSATVNNDICIQLPTYSIRVRKRTSHYATSSNIDYSSCDNLPSSFFHGSFWDDFVISNYYLASCPISPNVAALWRCPKRLLAIDQSRIRHAYYRHYQQNTFLGFSFCIRLKIRLALFLRPWTGSYIGIFSLLPYPSQESSIFQVAFFSLQNPVLLL